MNRPSHPPAPDDTPRHEPSDAKVVVLVSGLGPEVASDRAVVESLARSRHRALAARALLDAPHHAGEVLVRRMRRLLAELDAELVHAVAPGTRTDPGLYGTAARALADKPAAFAVVCGALVSASEGADAEAIATTRSWADAVVDCPLLLDPVRVLSLAVCRRASLLAWLDAMSSVPRIDRQVLAETFYGRLSFPDAAAGPVLRTSQALVTWPPGQRRTALARQLGLEALAAGDLASAEAHLERALIEDPTDREALLRYLEVLPYPDGLSKASQAFREYLHRDPDDSELRTLAAGITRDLTRAKAPLGGVVLELRR